MTQCIQNVFTKARILYPLKPPRQYWRGGFNPLSRRGNTRGFMPSFLGLTFHLAGVCTLFSESPKVSPMMLWLHAPGHLSRPLPL
jgi:hypothetical protein